jgi:peptidoglycan/LPS O-acetylase OafA/YrhL
MLGTLRLGLAIGVVLFHAGWRPGGVRIGVCCVVIFYMISGYAMSGLAGSFLRAPADGFGRGVLRFWRDRALRLFPQYLLWVAVSAFVVFGLNRIWLFQQGPFSATAAIANLTMAPLSLYMYIPDLNRMMLLPQGWSLSTELGFYALFPLVWRSRAVAWAALAGGGAVLGLALAGVLNPDWYGYRLLPGTLPFFLTGRALFLRDRAMLLAVAVLFVALALVTLAAGALDEGYNREVLLAAFLGPPAVVLAARARAWPLDALCGHVSYGTYLAHIAIITGALGSIESVAMRAPAAALLSAAAGLLSYRLVEVPVNKLRHRLKRN